MDKLFLKLYVLELGKNTPWNLYLNHQIICILRQRSSQYIYWIVLSRRNLAGGSTGKEAVHGCLQTQLSQEILTVTSLQASIRALTFTHKFNSWCQVDPQSNSPLVPHFIRGGEVWIYILGRNRSGSGPFFFFWGIFSVEEKEEKWIWILSVRTPLYEFYTNDTIWFKSSFVIFSFIFRREYQNFWVSWV